jgi:hypothetical protein
MAPAVAKPAAAGRAAAALGTLGSPGSRVEVRPAAAGASWLRKALVAASLGCTACASHVGLEGQGAPQSVRAAATHGVTSIAAQAGEGAHTLVHVAAPAQTPASAATAKDPNDLGDANLPPVTVIVDGKAYKAINPLERVRLCKEIAQEEKLQRAGLDWKDLYGVVNAETAWVARDGMGRNGRVSYGLAQLEKPTAAALGIADPSDPRQALHAVSRLIKEAASWGLRDNGRAALSVYYNLSSHARAEWDGKVESLPQETQLHIRNVADGRAIAQRLERERQRYDVAHLRATLTNGVAPVHSAEQAGAAHELGSHAMHYDRSRG